MELSGMICSRCQTHPSVEILTQRIGENAENCVQLFGHTTIPAPFLVFPSNPKTPFKINLLENTLQNPNVENVRIQMDLWGK